jgi:hypothetical protein
VVTNKPLILLFLGSAILLGVFEAETGEQKNPVHRSMPNRAQRNLAKDLEDDDDGARQLFLLGDESVSPLIKFLSDPDDGKRIAAARGLAYIGAPQGMQALRNAIKTEKDEEAKSVISCFLAGGLVETKSEADLNFLRASVESARHADDDDWDLPGFCAALALGMKGGNDSLLLLRKAAKANDPAEIEKAIRWMEEKKSIPKRATPNGLIRDEELIEKIVLDGTFFVEGERDNTSVEQLTLNRARNKALVTLEIDRTKCARGYDLVLAKESGVWRVVGIWFAWTADKVTPPR